MGLKTNNVGAFTLDGKFYRLKAFVREEIYLVKLQKAFWDTRREKNMERSTNTYEASTNKNRQEKNRERKSLKAVATKTYTKSEEAYDSKLVFSDLIFTVAPAPAKV